MKPLEVQACFGTGVISDLSYFIYKPWTFVKETKFYKTQHFPLTIALSTLDLTWYALAHFNIAFICFS